MILNASKNDLKNVAENLILEQMIQGSTTRVVVGSTANISGGIMEEEEGWRFYNPTEFLSQKYFEKYNEWDPINLYKYK